MTAEDLYQEIKRALDHFGLSFADKSQVKVNILGDVITFVHEGRAVSLNPKKAKFGDE